VSDQHVDIVKNEWLAGFQVLVARVTVEDGDIHVVTSDPKWEEVVRRPILDRATGDTVNSAKDPQHFLESLPSAITSSYLFATAPHPQDKCPFGSACVLPLQQADLRSAAG
jgi:hypothetical protein